jgi:hypothetical protein
MIISPDACLTRPTAWALKREIRCRLIPGLREDRTSAAVRGAIGAKRTWQVVHAGVATSNPGNGRRAISAVSGALFVK